MADERRKGLPERRKTDRRLRSERRKLSLGGPIMNDRRTRFSILYFIIAFVILIGLNYMMSKQSTRELAYSELKQRIAAGQIRDVTLGPEVMRAVVVDS